MDRIWLAAAAALVLATSGAAGQAPAPATSTDAAKAKRGAIRQCKRECERLYPVQIRTVGEGTTLQRTEITGNVAAHDMCDRGCDAGEPPR